MSKYIFPILLVVLSLSSCSVLQKGSKPENMPAFVLNVEDYCNTQEDYKSLYISNIESSFLINDEKYNAKISIYYIPDSVIFFTAINTGFEIIRGAVFPDSVYIINRLEKTVYVDKFDQIHQESVISFTDLELLLDKRSLCENRSRLQLVNSFLKLDFSTQNVTRKVLWTNDFYALASFQFFHKKTGEYILGEFNADKELKIYSDYVLGPVEVTANEGVIEYDRKLSVNLSVNRAKYSYFYLR